jgi:hypothetical protein
MRIASPRSLKGQFMPYVNIRITREGATPAQKAELIAGATELLQTRPGQEPGDDVRDHRRGGHRQLGRGG